jgi:hypothetical protein
MTLSITLYCHYAAECYEFRYGGCRYSECHGADKLVVHSYCLLYFTFSCIRSNVAG